MASSSQPKQDHSSGGKPRISKDDATKLTLSLTLFASAAAQIDVATKAMTEAYELLVRVDRHHLNNRTLKDRVKDIRFCAKEIAVMGVSDILRTDRPIGAGPAQTGEKVTEEALSKTEMKALWDSLPDAVTKKITLNDFESTINGITQQSPELLKEVGEEDKKVPSERAVKSEAPVAMGLAKEMEEEEEHAKESAQTPGEEGKKANKRKKSKKGKEVQSDTVEEPDNNLVFFNSNFERISPNASEAKELAKEMKVKRAMDRVERALAGELDGEGNLADAIRTLQEYQAMRGEDGEGKREAE